MPGENCEIIAQGKEQILVTTSSSWQCITWMLLLLFLLIVTGLDHPQRAGRENVEKNLHKQPVIWKLFVEIC